MNADEPEVAKLTVVREAHPAADLFPLMREDELRALAEDIAEHTLLQAIVLDAEGRVVDGRNRLAACRLANVEPRFEKLDPEVDPVDYVVSANVMRRDLTRDQLAVVAAEWWPLFEAKRGRPGKGDRPGHLKTRDVLAQKFGVGKNAIQQARWLLERHPEVAGRVKAGEVALGDAYEEWKVDALNEATADPDHEWESLPPKDDDAPWKMVINCETEEERDAVLKAMGIARPSPRTVHVRWSDRGAQD